jgi:hypothetical protein
MEQVLGPRNREFANLTNEANEIRRTFFPLFDRIPREFNRMRRWMERRDIRYQAYSMDESPAAEQPYEREVDQGTAVGNVNPESQPEIPVSVSEGDQSQEVENLRRRMAALSNPFAGHDNTENRPQQDEEVQGATALPQPITRANANNQNTVQVREASDTSCDRAIALLLQQELNADVRGHPTFAELMRDSPDGDRPINRQNEVPAAYVEPETVRRAREVFNGMTGGLLQFPMFIPAGAEGNLDRYRPPRQQTGAIRRRNPIENQQPESPSRNTRQSVNQASGGLNEPS